MPVESTFELLSANCAYCEPGEECQHRFAFFEVFNCSYDSDHLPGKDVVAVFARSLLRVLKRVDDVDGFLKCVADENYRLPLLLRPIFDDDYSGLFDEKDPTKALPSYVPLYHAEGYLSTLFDECPHLYGEDLDYDGDSPGSGESFKYYWAPSPAKALRWLKKEFRTDAKSLAKVAREIDRFAE